METDSCRRLLPGIVVAVACVACLVAAPLASVVPAVAVPADPASRQVDRKQLFASLLSETNRARRENDQAALTSSSELDAVAQAHAEDMIARGYFDHVSPEGEGPGDRLVRISPKTIFVGVRENILQTESDADDFFSPRGARVVEAWMDSPGHRENLLNSETTQVGFGDATGVRHGRLVECTVQLFASILGRWENAPQSSIQSPARWGAELLVPAEFFLGDETHPDKRYADPSDRSRFWIGGVPLVIVATGSAGPAEGAQRLVEFPRVAPGNYKLLVRVYGASAYQAMRKVKVEASPSQQRPELPQRGAATRASSDVLPGTPDSDRRAGSDSTHLR